VNRGSRMMHKNLPIWYLNRETARAQNEFHSLGKNVNLSRKRESTRWSSWKFQTCCPRCKTTKTNFRKPSSAGCGLLKKSKHSAKPKAFFTWPQLQSGMRATKMKMNFRPRMKVPPTKKWTLWRLKNRSKWTCRHFLIWRHLASNENLLISLKRWP